MSEEMNDNNVAPQQISQILLCLLCYMLLLAVVIPASQSLHLPHFPDSPEGVVPRPLILGLSWDVVNMQICFKTFLTALAGCLSWIRSRPVWFNFNRNKSLSILKVRILSDYEQKFSFLLLHVNTLSESANHKATAHYIEAFRRGKLNLFQFISSIRKQQMGDLR